MIVVVDIGNSRIKWAGFDAGRIVDARSTSYGAPADSALTELLATVPAGAQRMFIASVGRPELGERLAERARRDCGLAVGFAATEAAACGVRAAYADPTRLGVDRWAAIVAAWCDGGGPVCIVDAGTTLTFDVVATDGRHCGGLIVVGPALGIDALARRTARIGTLSPTDLNLTLPVPDSLFGRDTQSAVAHGAMLAAAGLVDRAVAHAARLMGRSPRVLMTGGTAAALEPWLSVSVERRPHLVLEGLGRLAIDRTE